MSSERVDTTLGDVLTFKRGYDLPSSERRKGDFPIVSSSGLSGFHDQPKAKAPGVVTGRYGTIGELFFLEEDYWPLNTALYVSDFKGNFPRYIYYFLHSVLFSQYSDKSSVPGVNRNHLHAIETSFEKNEEIQKSVAKILGDLDDKIDLLRDMNATLEEIARAVFRAWFVDFEPVHAKANGATSFRGMPQELFDLLPVEFEPSSIGDVPNGWSVGRVGDVIKLLRTSVKPFENPNLKYQHFSLPAFDRGQEADIEKGETIKSGKFAIPPNAVLFSKLNPRIPRIWMPQPSHNDIPQIASTEFLVCVPKTEWSREYAYCLVNQSKFLDELTKRATGTSNSHQRIKPKEFEDTQVVLPPIECRTGFAKFAQPLLKRVIVNRGHISVLSQLRDTLLPKLISGEIDIPDLEALTDGG